MHQAKRVRSLPKLTKVDTDPRWRKTFYSNKRPSLETSISPFISFGYSLALMAFYIMFTTAYATLYYYLTSMARHLA